MYRIGHRGAAGHAPENTLRSVAKALELGVDLVEVDVQRSRDGRLVVIHDKLVDRTTDGRGYVTDLSFEELRRLDAGDGQKIPCLEEVLSLVDDRAGIMLEIITPGTAGAVHEAVWRAEFPGEVVYASFLHSELLDLHAREPAGSRLALLEGVPIDALGFARAAKATHVGLSRDSITPEFLADLRREGLKVFVFTVNHPVEIQRVKSLGVHGIVSDHPERL
jgi:glycerophosphoryl diester phosphodiesterase